MTGQTRRTGDLPGSPRIIEPKISLTWLLSSAGTILAFLGVLLWNVAGQSGKLDTLVANSAKADAKVEVLKDSQYALQRITDTNTLRITALESRNK